jgi:hypothetical protein
MVADLRLGRDNRIGRMMCIVVKYWLRLLNVGIHEVVRKSYEWRMNNIRVDSWVNK